MQDLTADPLFVGATRPPMRWGVTYSALLFNMVFTMEAFLLTKNLLTLLLCAPIHGVCMLLCARDARFFDLVLLWARTRLPAFFANWRLWKASSYSPAGDDIAGSRRTPPGRLDRTRSRASAESRHAGPEARARAAPRVHRRGTHSLPRARGADRHSHRSSATTCRPCGSAARVSKHATMRSSTTGTSASTCCGGISRVRGSRCGRISFADPFRLDDRGDDATTRIRQPFSPSRCTRAIAGD